jgi:hypothetical protein
VVRGHRALKRNARVSESLRKDLAVVTKLDDVSTALTGSAACSSWPLRKTGTDGDFSDFANLAYVEGP